MSDLATTHRTTSLFSSPFSSPYSAVPSSPTRYRDQARALLGRAKHKASGAMEGLKHSDSIGGVAAQSAAPFVAGGAMGVMDASHMGQQFEAYIHHVASPSTVAFALGAALRWSGWDRKYPKLRFANTALLRAGFPIMGYKAGVRLAQSSLLQGGSGGAKTAGAPVAGAIGPSTTQSVASQAREPIPGEVTVS